MCQHESASVQVWGTWGRQFESGLPDAEAYYCIAIICPFYCAICS